jgi:hypothetical protein
MRRLKGLRPSPAIVVALLALVAGLAGTAVAGPDASTSAVTKKKAKKIANKQITKRAPGLTVGNSEKLDGLDANQLTPASSNNVQSSNQDLSPADQVVLSTTITTAGTSTVLANAAVRLDSNGGGDDQATCFIRIAGSDGPPSFTGIPDVGADEITIPAVHGQSVGTGTHTVELLCRITGGSVVQVEDAGLNVSAHL